MKLVTQVNACYFTFQHITASYLIFITILMIRLSSGLSSFVYKESQLKQNTSQEANADSGVYIGLHSHSNKGINLAILLQELCVFDRFDVCILQN